MHPTPVSRSRFASLHASHTTSNVARTLLRHSARSLTRVHAQQPQQQQQQQQSLASGPLQSHIESLQQQVQLLTQLYQQSQQQNAALAAEVQALSARLAAVDAPQQQQNTQEPPAAQQQQESQTNMRKQKQTQRPAAQQQGQQEQQEQQQQQQQQQQHSATALPAVIADSAPAPDLYRQSVLDCFSWQVLAAVYQVEAADRDDLAPQQLLCTIHRLGELLQRDSSGGSSNTRSSSNNDSNGAQGDVGSVADFALLLLTHLTEHPFLAPEQQQQEQKGSYALTLREMQEVLRIAAQVARQPLPPSLQQGLQRLINRACVKSSSELQQRKLDGSDSLELCAVTGACLLLGLHLPPALQAVMAGISDGTRPAPSLPNGLPRDRRALFAAASIVLAAATAAPAAADSVGRSNQDGRQKQQQEQPSTVMSSMEVLTDALAWLSQFEPGSGEHLGPLYALRMVLIPLAVLQQLQLQQRPSPATAAMKNPGVIWGVRDVGDTVQQCIKADMEQQTKQQQQERWGQQAASSSGSSGVSNDGWTVYTAATALVILSCLEACELQPGCVHAFTLAAAAQGQLSSLPADMLPRLVPLVAEVSGEEADPWDTKELSFTPWMMAVLQHLTDTVSSRTYPLPALLSMVATLLQQARLASSRSRWGGADQYLAACDAAVAASAQAYTIADGSSSLAAPDAAAVAQLLPQLEAAGISPATVAQLRALLAPAQQGQQQQQQQSLQELAELERTDAAADAAAVERRGLMKGGSPSDAAAPAAAAAASAAAVPASAPQQAVPAGPAGAPDSSSSSSRAVEPTPAAATATPAAVAAAELLELVGQSAAAAGGISPAAVDRQKLQQLVGQVVAALHAGGSSSSSDPAGVMAQLLGPGQSAHLLRGLAGISSQQQDEEQLQQQEPFSDMQGLRELLAAAAGCVQANRAATAAVAAGGLGTLTALVQLGLPVDPDWVQKLTADMDAAAGGGFKRSSSKGDSSSGSSWSEVSADLPGYLWALDSIQQSPSVLQCKAFCSKLAAQQGLQQLQLAPQEQAQLLVLLASSCSAAAAGSSERAAAQAAQDLKQQLQGVFAAGLPAVLSHLQQGGQLPSGLATALVSALHDITSDSSSSSGGKVPQQQKRPAAAGGKQAAGRSPTAAPAVVAKPSSNPAAAAADMQQGWVRLLEAALAATAESQTAGSAQQHATDLLPVLWLLHGLPSSCEVPRALRQRALDALAARVSQESAPLHPADASVLLRHAASLVLALHPELSQLGAVPDPGGLGGVLVQLLQDVEAAGWEGVGAHELVTLPRLLGRVKLEAQEKEAYAAAVYVRLQALRAAPAAEVAAASKQGSGPVDLLAGLCWLVMEGRPGEAGDTTLNGLHAVVHSSAADSSSSSSSRSSTDDGVQGAKLREMFKLTAALTGPLLPTLSGPQLVDLAHAFAMGDMLGSDTWRQILSAAGAADRGSAAAVGGLTKALAARLAKPQELGGQLDAGQQLALLCVVARLQELCVREGDGEGASAVVAQLLKPVLAATQPHLAAWHPASLTYAIHVLGDLLVSTRDTFPPKLTAAVTAWQAAAVAALQPSLPRLLPESLLQLLLGSQRIVLGTGQQSSLSDSQGQQQQQGGKDTPAGSGNSEQQLLQTAVLTSALMGLSQQLHQLTGEQLVALLLSCSSLDTADKAFGEAVLGQLEPHLQSLRVDVLVGVLTALGRWPQYRRPLPTEAWLGAFLAAAEAELAPYLTVTSAAAAPGDTATDVSSSSSSQQAAAVLERHRELGGTLPDNLAQMAYMLGMLGMLPSGDWRGKFYLAISSLLPEFSPVAAANLLHGMAMWMVPLRAQKSAAAAAAAAAGASPDAVAAAGGFSGADYPARLVDALAAFAGGPKGLAGLSLSSNLVVPQALKAVGWAPDEGLVQMNLAMISKYLQDLQTQLEQVDARSQEASAALARLATKPAGKSKTSQTQTHTATLRQLKTAAAEIEAETAAWEAILNAWDALAPADSAEQQQQQQAQAQAQAQQQRLVEGSSRRFDADGLMDSMLAAAGMAPPAVPSGSAPGVGFAAGAEAWLRPDVDELLMDGAVSGSDAVDELGCVLDAEFEQL